MTPKSDWSHAVGQWKGWTLLVFAFVLVFAMASVAVAQLYTDGGLSAAPYAPYTAGPVVNEVPYAPYTAGPVVREVPYAPYTEKPYAPYTAGPCVREVPYAPYTEKPYAPYELPR